ncbi:MAG: L-lactate dehydrogenase complex protein LldG [Verrucomicrobia bacterium]|nr:MAG: L-lactate dehydrogenase complex protein LldG [Verrucomicrobiota bacterium]
MDGHPEEAMNRNDLFQKLRASAPASPEPYPDYDDAMLLSRTGHPTDLEASFRQQFTSINGYAFDSPGPLISLLRATANTRGYCDPALFPILGQPLADAGLEVSTLYHRSRYDDYQFGITRASGAIAETGTLILTDEQTSDRLAALSPWVHVAVLDPATIAPSIPEAIKRFGSSVNIIWVTGPSRTADVEGILIEGVHGPGVQVAYLSPVLSWTAPASPSF